MFTNPSLAKEFAAIAATYYSMLLQGHRKCTKQVHSGTGRFFLLLTKLTSFLYIE
jgi:hypothetical protein